jgi:DNA ligase-1
LIIRNPYPFYLAYAVEEELNKLGNPDEWLAEWKWDGIRGQLIKRNNELFVWSRGEELMTEKFPEYEILKTLLPNGIVLDGEIISGKPSAANNNLSLKYFPLQIYKHVSAEKTSQKNNYRKRRLFLSYTIYWNIIVKIVAKKHERKKGNFGIIIQPLQHPQYFYLRNLIQFLGRVAEIRTESRNHGAEGIMLKRKNSPYQVGRKRGDWWKWKIDPMVIDAVMIYAQKGHGRRSNLYTDYTFAVKDGEKLVSFTKAIRV